LVRSYPVLFQSLFFKVTFEVKSEIRKTALVVIFITDMLGRRLEMESDGHLSSDAHLCYIVSGNTEQLVASWDKVLADSASNNTLQVR